MDAAGPATWPIDATWPAPWPAAASYAYQRATPCAWGGGGVPPPPPPWLEGWPYWLSKGLLHWPPPLVNGLRRLPGLTDITCASN
eukprot:498680-Prorocentrum_minimum.AAC.1